MLKHAEKLIGLPYYTYRSSTIYDGLANNTKAAYFAGQPGTRLPHLLLDEARQRSTLDWINGQFNLVITGEGVTGTRLLHWHVAN